MRRGSQRVRSSGGRGRCECRLHWAPLMPQQGRLTGAPSARDGWQSAVSAAVSPWLLRARGATSRSISWTLPTLAERTVAATSRLAACEPSAIEGDVRVPEDVAGMVASTRRCARRADDSRQQRRRADLEAAARRHRSRVGLGDRHQPQGMLSLHPGRRPAHARPWRRHHHQHRFGLQPHCVCCALLVHRQQGWHRDVHQGLGSRARPVRHSRQLRGARSSRSRTAPGSNIRTTPGAGGR